MPQVDLQFAKFAANMRQKNPSIKQWEITDAWLDTHHSIHQEIPNQPKKDSLDQNDEQMSTSQQDVINNYSPNEYRIEDEEQVNTPEAAEVQTHLQQIAAKNPTLGLKLDCVGKKDSTGADSRIWYIFSNKTTPTTTGPQAMKWGGYNTNELKNMSTELQKMGDQGIGSFFNSTKPNQPQPPPRTA